MKLKPETWTYFVLNVIRIIIIFGASIALVSIMALTVNEEESSSTEKASTAATVMLC